MAWQVWREEAAYARAKSHSMLMAIQMMRNGLLSSSMGSLACALRCASFSPRTGRGNQSTLMNTGLYCCLLCDLVRGPDQL